MCGILLSIGTDASPAANWPRLVENIKRRDYQREGAIELNALTINYYASVLSLRGNIEYATSQPFEHNRFAMWYNGELYDKEAVSSDINDGQLLFDRFISALSDTNDEYAINRVFESIVGEWALVFLDKQHATLYLARDCLGRRSLLWNRSQASGNDRFVIASTGIKGETDIEWEEVPATGYFSLSLSKDCDISSSIKHHEWSGSKRFTLNTTIPTADLSSFYTQQAFLSTRSEFKSRLSEAVRVRVQTIPLKSPNPRLGILFSGGLDCMVLAALAHLQIPIDEPIDLLTVAFASSRSTYESCPDRITARQGVAELSENFKREWRLVCVDVSEEESDLWRERVCELTAPCGSVMDLSIAIAFWFAARGVGEHNGEAYSSEVKVLLSGLGADEQLGGYGRHLCRYGQHGYEAFIAELQLDVSRLPTRNLGRDDRIVGDHGREIRFPYLDECVARFLSDLEVHFKCNPNLAKGTGDKIILRSLARELGLTLTSKEPKRAVQFGARSAKMKNRNEKGTDSIE